MIRFLFFILALAFLGWGIVWVIRYFFGANLRFKSEMMRKKVNDEEYDVSKKITEEYENDSRYKQG